MIEVVVANNRCHVPLHRSETVQLVTSILHHEQKFQAAISVVFVGDRFIQSLNVKYLNHPSTTDVIAFGLSDGQEVQGEIYVNVRQAQRQARRFSISWSEETRRLVTHGVLHLLGYNDQRTNERKKMFRKQEGYLRS